MTNVPRIVAPGSTSCRSVRGLEATGSARFPGTYECDWVRLKNLGLRSSGTLEFEALGARSDECLEDCGPRELNVW